jgi:hypothetical protein
MFAELHSDINFRKSSLLHLMGQPYCKKCRTAKVKDGIITYFLATISLNDTMSLKFDATSSVLPSLSPCLHFIKMCLN